MRTRTASADADVASIGDVAGYAEVESDDAFALGEGALDSDLPVADLPPVTIEAFDMRAEEPDEPPFDPPEFGDEEEDLELIVGSIADSAPNLSAAIPSGPEGCAIADAPAPEVVTDDQGEDAVTARADGECNVDAVEHAAEEAPEFDEEPPPFDPPDDDEASAVFSKVTLHALNEAAPNELLLVTPTQAASTRLPERNLMRSDEALEAKTPSQPAPPIAIHIFWDRVEMGAVFGQLEADKRMSRASGGATRGGLDAAIERYATGPSPDLLIIDSNLGVAQLLAGLDRLALVLDPRTKVMVIGAVNDIGLLRELAVRGVSEYFVPPVTSDALVEAICALFASANTSRVIAVMGARGGVGASTIAQNIAWAIAERQQLGAALVDLDVAFGTAAFHMQLGDAPNLASALAAPGDEAALEASAAHASPRFQVMSAPANVALGSDIDLNALDALIVNARRISPFVVLDLPHHWAGWVKHALSLADDVLLVSGPDLAGLAATKNLIEQAKATRPGASEPMLVLSMAGVPKRPEIRLKEFADAAGATPIASIAFDPQTLGEACASGLMLSEAAPKSPAALAMDVIATALTGREVVARTMPVRKRFTAPAETPTPRAQVAETPSKLVDEPPAAPAAARAPIAPVEARQEMAELPSEAAPLMLTTLAPPLPQTRSLRRACSRADARQRDVERQQRPRTGRPGLVRAALALVTLIALGVWYAQNGAEAVATRAAAPAPIDLNERYTTAEQMLRRGETDAAVALVQRVAQAGLPAAQYRLAKFYEAGEVLGADLRAARLWTERAALGGHAQAMHDLGVYYARGEGGARDDAAAFRWFRQAAQHGVADSQFNLGVMYEQGRGVTANADEALFWFTLAAANGDADAAARVMAMEALVTPMQIEQAQSRAAAFAE